MTMIIVHDAHGQEHHVEVANGLSVMEALRPLELGIEGECEGATACATCHVWVDAAWFDRLPKQSDAELDMLDCAFRVRDTSRLSCQIMMGAGLEGLTLAIPHARDG